jgi:hypothetical protein
VVSFTPRPLYPWYILDRRLGRPQSRSGLYGKEKYLTPAWNQNPDVQPVVIPTKLSRLLMFTHMKLKTEKGIAILLLKCELELSITQMY